MITSLERKLAKYQRNLSTQRRRKGRQRIAVKERQKKARSDVMSRSSSSTSSSDSFDWNWKSPRKCAVAGKLKLSGFVCRFDDCQTSMFFIYEKRRHARKCVIWPILGTSFSANRHIYILYREREGGKTKKHSNLNSSGVASVIFRVVTCHVGGVERKMEVPCHVVRHVGAMEDVIFSHVS